MFNFFLCTCKETLSRHLETRIGAYLRTELAYTGQRREGKRNRVLGYSTEPLNQSNVKTFPLECLFPRTNHSLIT
jgi:hypothetical protein